MKANSAVSRSGVTKAMFVAALVAVMAGGLSGGCGKKEITRPEEPPPPVPDAVAASLADSGWAHFVARDFAGARGFFQQALEQQRAADTDAADYTDALAGRGWSELRMDSLSAAIESFSAAVASAGYWRDYASQADALAGQAVMASKDSDYPTAAATGATAVQVGGESYRLGLRPGRPGRVYDAAFTVRHVRLIVAEAYLRQGFYDLAYDQLVGIDVTVLDRVNPGSERFVELLTEEIALISQGLS